MSVGGLGMMVLVKERKRGLPDARDRLYMLVECTLKMVVVK